MSTDGDGNTQKVTGVTDLNDAGQRRIHYRRVLLRLFGRLLPYRGELTVAMLAILVYSGTTVALPWIVKIAIDRYIANDSGDLTGLTRMVALFMGVAVVQFAVIYLHGRILVSVGQRLIYAVRAEIFGRIQSLSMAFFDRNRTGSIMSRVHDDVSQVDELTFIVVRSVANSLAIVGIAAAMLVMNAPLALVTLALVVGLVPLLSRWQSLAQGALQRTRQTIAEVSSIAQENISGVRVVQSLNRQERNIAIFEEANEDHLASSLQVSRYLSALTPTVQTVSAVVFVLLVAVGGEMVVRGSLEVGIIVAFALYVERLFDPIREVTANFEQLQRTVVSADRIFELMDIPPAVADRPNAVSLSRVRGDVRFENVGFHYSAGTPVLHDIDLKVQAGWTIAIVGPTGAGKTTLISLLLRYYDVVQGRITVDGHDIRDVKLRSLSRQVGVVLQEPSLFSGTVRENIRYNRAEVSDEQIEYAARAVRAHQFILDLERGYDTPLLERGANLSVGQRQLISFARALAGDPRILILDEATANIDTYTEVLIQQALAELLKDRTALVIAHRLSTVRNADRIVVMDQGRIVEQGTHDQLAAAGGLYSRLQSYTIDTG